jgi:ADP-heptose:LPS heptosyltransferase
VRILLFKPDNIGDFVLFTGAARRLAFHLGEENLVLCVTSQLAPLAKEQFPRAEVISLPLAAKRKVVNLFLVNFVNCLPAWWQLRRTKVDAAVCFRNMRTFLDTFLYYSAKSSRFLAMENLLARSRRRSRVLVEVLARRLFRPEILPYPESELTPTELEANRVLVSRVLDREVALSEVLPHLVPAAPSLGNYWVCCPLSSQPTKDYPFDGWREIFERVRNLARETLLVGSAAQAAALSELEGQLRVAGIEKARVEVPESLGQFVNLLAGARMVLTIDTAASHIATALDRPCLVLFSERGKGMFGPWQRSEVQRWLLPEFAVGHDGKWHEGISPERAAQAIRRIAEDPSGAAPRGSTT